MSSFRILAVLVSLVAVVGCAQSSAPLSGTVVTRDALGAIHWAGQDVLESASHWQLLAVDTADSLVGCLDGKTFLSRVSGEQEPYCHRDVSGLAGKPLYLELTDSAVPFSAAFHELLTTELVRRGRLVTLNQEDSLVVRYRVQFVKRRGKVPLNSVPGDYALLGAGVWVLRHSGISELLALGTLADIHAAANEFGGSQVIITTSLMDGDSFVMRRTGAYFIHDVDVGHYLGNAPGAGLVSTLKPGATAPPVRTFNVEAE